ncbi:hypothetical protein C5S31_07835 [ANME-1 cluster archaeon GoMg2]|nr:hypothetical protein [ANME-1 cluster archaeon GoMg2]
MKLLTGTLVVALLIMIGYIAIQYTETMPGLSDPGECLNLDVYTEYFRSDVYNKKLPYSKAAGSRVCLVNYKNATDPTWNELISFLNSDDTDEILYIEGSFVCADFAEMLHNNAETAGIKAAFVCVDFASDDEDGHALNAFNTTDRGLVYVDCTGEGFLHPVSHSQIFKDSTRYCPHFNYSCDKIAYIVEGEECGMINIDKASALEYWFYEDYAAKWNEHERELEAYTSEVNEYNRAIAAHDKEVKAYEAAVGGRTSISDPGEYERLDKRYKKLKAREKELDVTGDELETKRERLAERQEDLGWYRWKPLSVVTDVKVHW